MRLAEEKQAFFIGTSLLCFESPRQKKSAVLLVCHFWELVVRLKLQEPAIGQ